MPQSQCSNFHRVTPAAGSPSDAVSPGEPPPRGVDVCTPGTRHGLVGPGGCRQAGSASALSAGLRQQGARPIVKVVQRARPINNAYQVGFIQCPHDKIRLLGLTRYTTSTLRSSAMLGPSHPDTKVRWTGDDDDTPL